LVIEWSLHGHVFLPSWELAAVHVMGYCAFDV
jgi:hypothetical protein